MQRRSLLRHSLLALAATAATLAATSPAWAQPKEKVILMLNWYVYSEHAPFFLGKERGYFDQEGIDLEIQEGRGAGVTVQAIAAGSAQFGYADVATMIKAAAKGAPVVSVGVLLQTSPMAVMGFAEKNIKTLHATSPSAGHLLISNCRMTVRDLALTGPFKLFFPEALRLHQLQLLAGFMLAHGERLARLGICGRVAKPVEGFQFVTL